MFQQLFDLLQHAIGTNQFLSGGLVLALLGGALAYFRRLPMEIWMRMRSQCFITLDILADDPACLWVKSWLGEQRIFGGNRNLSVSTKSFRGDPDMEEVGDTYAFFTPAPGTHFVMFKRHFVWVSRIRDEVEHGANLYRERLVIRILGRDVKVAKDLISAAKITAERPPGNYIKVHRHSYGGWDAPTFVAGRNPNSVYLPDNQFERLAKDAEHFFNNSEWYAERGIPHRRGYLLYGEPGSGKSTTILALATALRVPVYKLSMSGNVTDDSLENLLSWTPNRCIVMLEDIDATFVKRSSTKNKDGSPVKSVTFSGLLNALDGVGASESRLVIMTTNHIDKLDSALIRPGRVDVRIHYTAATDEQIERAVNCICPWLDRKLWPKAGISMAEVQENLLAHCMSKATECFQDNETREKSVLRSTSTAV